MDEIKVLELGRENWKNQYELKHGIIWRFVDLNDPEAAAEELTSMKETYELLLLDGWDLSMTTDLLESLVDAWRVVYTENCLPYMDRLKPFLDRKMAWLLRQAEIEDFLQKLPYRYWNGQEGDKLSPKMLQIISSRRESSLSDIRMRGNAYLSLTGDFGETLQPLAAWSYNIVLRKDTPLDLFLEYRKEGDVELSLVIREDKDGAPATFLHRWEFTEQEMKASVRVYDGEERGFLSVSLYAKGKGTIDIGPLHFRRSRLDVGAYLPGGQLYHDASRQEFSTYFNPMDGKPPLNVYFGGYGTAEGFEGFYMLRKLKAPFLLIRDPRLEGGASYLGSPEYEEKLLSVIKETLEALHFTNEQMIISGLSMGSTGAIYYGAKLQPHAIVIGKPIVNEGKLALCARKIRPADFLTALDIVNLQRLSNPEFFEEASSEASGSLSSLGRTAEILDQKIWKEFDKTDFPNTEFAVSYMNEDDYDQTGYQDILKHLEGKKVRAYGKGITGRHNDNTTAVTNWFKHLYGRILQEDFGRT